MFEGKLPRAPTPIRVVYRTAGSFEISETFADSLAISEILGKVLEWKISSCVETIEVQLE